jgi:tRNA(fMet)-specific endonuclease VapC
MKSNEVFVGHKYFIRYINGRAPNIRERMRVENDLDIAVSAITQAELYAGSARSNTPVVSRKRQDVFLVRFAILPFDTAAAEKFAQVQAHLRKLGTPIGPYDIQIAAIALAHNLIVVSHNTQEFQRVPGLVLEDWE